MSAPRRDCRLCAHYFVTWIPSFPHGCRAMGFKSRRFPSEAVRQAMGGRDCLMFAPKPPPTPGLPQKGDPSRR